MPKGQYQRRATGGPTQPFGAKTVVGETATPDAPEVFVSNPVPDPAPAQAAVEQAEVAIAEAEQKVEELSLVDVNDCLKVGDFVGKGSRQISNSYGEFLVNPETGKVTKCL